MENLTAVDGGAALIIILSAILAFSRGLVRELMAILGWIGAAIAAYYFAPGVQPLVKELPVVGEFLSDSCELSVVAAFASVNPPPTWPWPGRFCRRARMWRSRPTWCFSEKSAFPGPCARLGRPKTG